MRKLSQLENINQALFELNPDDDEPEYWMEGTLAPVYDCFDNIEMYYAERAMFEAKLVKEVDEMSVPEPLKSSKENVDKLLSHDNSKSDAPVVQTSLVQISSLPVHQPIEIATSPVIQLPITTVENKVHNTTSTSNLTTVPATSCSTPKVPLTHPRTVTTVTRCNEFTRKSVPERYEVAKSFKVCFNCLKQGHQVNKCSNKTHCQVTNCKRHHHSLLHYECATPQPQPVRTNKLSPH